MRKQPVHVIRFGLIVANIWHNQTHSGERHNVTFTRLFRDGDLWRESSHFGRDDLLMLSKAADFAHTWIYQQNSGRNSEQNAPAAMQSQDEGLRDNQSSHTQEAR